MLSRISVLVFAISHVSARTFTVTNNCPYTVWPAVSVRPEIPFGNAQLTRVHSFTDPNVGTNKPDHATGWEQPAGAVEIFEVPDTWQAGRIWGRKDCDFSKENTLEACSSGNCNGGLECSPTAGTGIPPVTVAEWTLGQNGLPDNYDVSLVDGFNIPLAITNSADCPIADCPVDINAECPLELQHLTDGEIAGCKSACSANIDGNQGDSPNCCSGSHSVPATCPPEGVQFYDVFKGSCKNSYAYAYDESSGTALWTCDSAEEADYTVTFCP